MNASREQLLFGLALTKPAVERTEWLDRVCGDDKVSRSRLELLLAAYEQPETLFATQGEAARPTIKLDPDNAPPRRPWPDGRGATGGHQTVERYQVEERSRAVVALCRFTPAVTALTPIGTLLPLACLLGLPDRAATANASCRLNRCVTVLLDYSGKQRKTCRSRANASRHTATNSPFRIVGSGGLS